MIEGGPTYRCVSCIVASQASRVENVLIRNLRSASTSELPMKIVRPLILSDLKNPESQWTARDGAAERSQHAQSS
jgi:hypothetical protein